MIYDTPEVRRFQWHVVHGWETLIFFQYPWWNHKFTLSRRQWGYVLKESFRFVQLFISLKVYPRDRSQPTVPSLLFSCVSLNTAFRFRKGMYVSAPAFCVCTRHNNWHKELHFIKIHCHFLACFIVLVTVYYSQTPFSPSLLWRVSCN